MRTTAQHGRAFRALVAVVIVAISGCVPPPERSREELSHPTVLPTVRATSTQPAWSQLPLYFVENHGQADPRVGYYVTQRGLASYFTAEGVTYVLRRGTTPVKTDGETNAPVDDARPSRSAMKVDFLGADSSARPTGVEKTEAVFSYFKGTPEQWKAGLPTYRGVAYENLWPGIDLTYTSQDGHLEYAFVVHPGADPAQIALAYRGADRLTLAEDGTLDTSVGDGHIREGAPYTFQERDGQRLTVRSGFVVQEDAEVGSTIVGFEVSAYDTTIPLVIDPPVLAYSGFIGGTDANGFDAATGIDVDQDGAVYVGGTTASTEADFPDGDPNNNNQMDVPGFDQTQNGGGLDGFVVKVRPDGTGLVYATFLGGSQRDDVLALAVDGDGNVYLTGQTVSNQNQGFPLTTGAFDLTHNGSFDAFVTKLDPDGTGLAYSTYVGGSEVDVGVAIAIVPGCDSNCAAYVVGDTTSPNLFPSGLTGPDNSYNGGNSGGGLPTDAFVFKLNGAGSALDYGSYIGGNQNDIGRDVAVDVSGAAYVVGSTPSTESTFPNGTSLAALGVPGFDQTQNGQADAYVVKIKPDGTGFAYATFLGGSGTESGAHMGIAVDGSGNAFVAGETFSGTTATVQFPTVGGPDTTQAGNADVFITKLDPTGTTLVYSGFIGGAQSEAAGSVAIDSAGNAYVAGRTDSSTSQGFPATSGPDSTFGGGGDAFVAKVRSDGLGFAYVTYVGGQQSEDGVNIAVDRGGNAYLLGTTRVVAGDTDSFPTVVGPDLTFNGGKGDVFVTKVGVSADLSLTLSDVPDPIAPGQTLTYTLTVRNNGPDDALGIRVNDSLPAGLTLTSVTPSQGTCTGTNSVVCDLAGLANGASATIQIVVVPTSAAVLANTATVSSLTNDPSMANNTATATTSLNLVADLVTSLSIVPDPGVVGGALTYAVRVTNAGPSDAASTTVTVTWPNSVTFGSAAPSQGQCVAAPGQVACNLGAVVSGTYASIAIAVTPNSPAAIATTAIATSGVTDPNPGNNIVSLNTNIQAAPPASADLGLTLVDSPDPVTVGSPVTYTATVTNGGTGTATGAQFVATLPDGAAFVSATAGQGTCTNAATTVTCALGNLANSASTKVAIVVTPNTGGAVALTASVTSAVPDPSLVNNTAVQVTTANVAPVNPTQPPLDPCTPRPDHRVTVVRDVGASLRVTITAGGNGSNVQVGLRQLRFGAATNASIDVPGGPSGSPGNVTVPLPPGATSATFVVRQATPGSAVTVPLVIADDCGDFPTFVGGGVGAFQ